MSEKSQVTTSSSLTEHQELKTFTNERVLLITSDSTNAELKTIIWPRGKFKYSLDSGFVGEAEKVEQVSVGRRNSKTSKLNQKQVAVIANLERKSATQKSISKAVKTKNGVSKPTSWTVVVFIFYSVFFLLAYILSRKYHFV